MQLNIHYILSDTIIYSYRLKLSKKNPKTIGKTIKGFSILFYSKNEKDRMEVKKKCNSRVKGKKKKLVFVVVVLR